MRLAAHHDAVARCVMRLSIALGVKTRTTHISPPMSVHGASWRGRSPTSLPRGNRHD